MLLENIRHTCTKNRKKTSTSKTSVAPSVVLIIKNVFFYWNRIEEFSAFSTIKNKHFHVENVRINQFLYWNGMEDIILSSLQQLKIDMFMLNNMEESKTPWNSVLFLFTLILMKQISKLWTKDLILFADCHF